MVIVGGLVGGEGGEATSPFEGELSIWFDCSIYDVYQPSFYQCLINYS